MRISFQLILLLVILFGPTSLLLVSLPFSSYANLLELSTNRGFVFIVFNIVICSILAKSRGPSSEVDDRFVPFYGGLDHEAEEEQSKEKMDDDDANVDQSSSRSSSESDDYGSSSSSDSDDYLYNDDDYSNGYEEEDGDDDECESNDEIGWDSEDEGYDDQLENRIEEFIAKVIRGWKEELLADKLNSKQVD